MSIKKWFDRKVKFHSKHKSYLLQLVCEWGEFTGHRWIPGTKASDAELLYFALICAWVNGWVNNREAGDLRRHRAHYQATVMQCNSSFTSEAPSSIGTNGIVQYPSKKYSLEKQRHSTLHHFSQLQMAWAELWIYSCRLGKFREL